MGENQGMVWIILGVIVVGAVIIILGNTMKTSVSDTNDMVSEKATAALEEDVAA